MSIDDEFPTPPDAPADDGESRPPAGNGPLNLNAAHGIGEGVSAAADAAGLAAESLGAAAEGAGAAGELASGAAAAADGCGGCAGCSLVVLVALLTAGSALAASFLR